MRRKGLKATRKIVDRFVSFCAENGITNAEVFGGEPMLYGDLFQYTVKKLHARIPDLQIGVVTNGTLINEDIMSLLERKRVNVLVSIDGRKERHDAMRGEFDRIHKWFSRLANLDVITVAIQAGKIEGLYDHIRYLWSVGFRKGVFINIIYNYGWYDINDVRRFEHEYEDAVLGMMRGEGTLTCAVRLHRMLQRTDGYQECGLIGNGLACDWNGVFYPCMRAVELGPAFAIGDIWSGIDDVKNRTLRQRIRDEFLTSDSAERYPYVGYCPIAIYQKHGSFKKKWNKEYCEIIQIKAKIVSKHYHELQKYITGHSYQEGAMHNSEAA